MYTHAEGNSCVYIDRLGKERFRPDLPKDKPADHRYDEDLCSARPFSDGLAAFRDWSVESGKDNAYGFVSVRGTIVIPPRFAKVRGFSEGLAACAMSRRAAGYVRSADEPAGKEEELVWCVIDTQGRTVLPFKYDNIGPFRDGLAKFYGQEGYWGYIDRSGKVIIPAQFISAWNFREGLAEVVIADGTIALIDKTGRVVVRTEEKSW